VVTGGGFYVISRHSGSPLRSFSAASSWDLALPHALQRHGGNAGARRARLRPHIRCASLIIAIAPRRRHYFWHSEPRISGKNSLPPSSWAWPFRYALYGDGRDHFAAHGPVPEAHGYASLDQTNLALAVAGITFVILASALIASLSEQKRAEEALREAQADLAMSAG